MDTSENKQAPCQACLGGAQEHTCIENPDQFTEKTKVESMSGKINKACPACSGTGGEHTCIAS